jgi:diaminopimelate epimerase
MKLTFTKMHGLGNDFVVIDAIRQSIALSRAQIQWIAHRHFGVGCDQLLLVQVPETECADFRYRIFNADGREVEQCGNGARCFARFVRDQGLTDKNDIMVETTKGIIRIQLQSDGQVKVNMGTPRFAPPDIPFISDIQVPRYALEVEGNTVDIGAVSMGNPHAVLQIEDVEHAPVASLGPLIEVHPRFPQRVNVGFMQILTPEHIRLRVFERGVGETLACGSGACAAVVVGHNQGLLAEAVQVDLRGGSLRIEWQGGLAPVWMSGPAVRVFEGLIQL